jgi:hypothetical protein
MISMHRHPIGDGMCAPRIPREVAAVIAALQLKGGNAEALRGLEEREWESLLRFCDLAHLTLLLSHVETDGFPSWVVERLEKNAADNAARFEHVKATYQEAAAALDQAGVEYLMLKGFTQAPEYVAEARLRMQSDLDVYCPKEMISRAEAALTLIGYQSEQTVDYSRADHLPSLIRQGDWKWRGNAFDPEMPLSIELHFCLWNEDVSWFPVPEVDRFWDRRIRRSLEGMSFPALNPVDHLGYLALHILRGLLNGEWVIHHVHELATFLHNHAESDEFWRAWKKVHTDSFRALHAIAFFHGRAWFSCDVHREVQSEIAAMPPIHREWLNRYAGSSLEGMFRPNKDHVWLHASLINPARKRSALIWRTIIPSRISSVDAPAVRIRNRQLKESRIVNKYLRYAGYLISRAISHIRDVPILMWRGMTLWLSQRPIRKQF